MSHWSDPASSRVYDHPSAAPPVPRPREANDLPSRVTRLEEHANFQGWNVGRMERTALSRDQDLARAVEALHRRMAPIERWHHVMHMVLTWGWTLVRWVPGFLKFVVGVVVAVLVLRGKISVEGAQGLLKAIGFPGG